MVQVLRTPYGVPSEQSIPTRTAIAALEEPEGLWHQRGTPGLGGGDLAWVSLSGQRPSLQPLDPKAALV